MDGTVAPGLPGSQDISFFDLPAELRNQVYEIAIDDSNSFCSGLLLTCRQALLEGRAVRSRNKSITIEFGWVAPQYRDPYITELRIKRPDGCRNRFWHVYNFPYIADRLHTSGIMDCTRQLHINPTCGHRFVDYNKIVLTFPRDTRKEAPSMEIEGWNATGEQEAYRKDPYFDEMKTELEEEWSLWVAREGPDLRFSRGLFEALMKHVAYFMSDTMTHINEHLSRYP